MKYDKWLLEAREDLSPIELERFERFFKSAHTAGQNMILKILSASRRKGIESEVKAMQ